MPLSHNHTRRFGGVLRLYGSTVLEHFTQAKICVIGVGGVGSWTVEALARSGIGHLTLIDLDHIAESNINRQIQALPADLGKLKVTALTERIANIDATIKVTPIEAFAEPDTLCTLIDPDWDWVVDCIDGSRNKAALIAHCQRLKLHLVSAGGAGGLRDPSRIRITDLSQAKCDPLLARTRARLRREHGFHRNLQQGFGIPCVYSDERPNTNNFSGEDPVGQNMQGTHSGLNCSGYGSVVTVTATFGLMAASVVLNQLAGTTAPVDRKSNDL